MKQCVLDHLTHEFGKVGRSIGQGFNKADTDADMYVTAEGGKLVAIHIAADADELPNIKGRYEQNTRNRIHTLFIVNGDLLPKDQNAIEPDYWMALLHTLSLGRIYAYYCEEEGVSIRPIHMDWKWGGGPRTIEYGPPINVARLHTETINCTSKYVVGAFASAGFGEGAFWKKRQPGDEREFKFSWRNWSYSTGKKQTTPDPEEQEPAWDPWDDFNQTYGDTADHATWSETFGAGSARRERTRQAPPRRVAPVIPPRYYTILGVSASATFEEVKQAYRKKARQYHPDLHPNEKEKYTAKMADINAAFEALSKHLKAQ